VFTRNSVVFLSTLNSMMALIKSNASCSRCHFAIYKTQNLRSC